MSCSTKICQHDYIDFDWAEPHPFYKICKKCKKIISNNGESFDPPDFPFSNYLCIVKRGNTMYRFVRKFMDRDHAIRELTEEGYEIYGLYVK